MQMQYLLSMYFHAFVNIYGDYFRIYTGINKKNSIQVSVNMWSSCQ